MNLYANWTLFTFKRIRATLCLGADLAISILPYRRLSAQSSHSGRQERCGGRRANRNRQWVDWGWSTVKSLEEEDASDASQGWRLTEHRGPPWWCKRRRNGSNDRNMEKRERRQETPKIIFAEGDAKRGWEEKDQYAVFDSWWNLTEVTRPVSVTPCWTLLY